MLHLRLASGLHKYLYANANPVYYLDPTGNVALANVMMGVTVASILWSTVQFALEPNVVNGGFLAFDLATAGAGSKLLGIAKAALAARAAKRASTLSRAFSGGKKAIDAYRFRLVSTVVGTYDDIRKGISAAGGSGIFQANHLNQLAAFKGIPKNMGLAIPLEGSAKIAGTSHNAFHKSLDGFWDLYRKNASRATQTVKEFDYQLAVQKALSVAGVNGNDALVLADAAVKQAKHFGYFSGRSGKQIRIPNRTTAR